MSLGKAPVKTSNLLENGTASAWYLALRRVVAVTMIAAALLPFLDPAAKAASAKALQSTVQLANRLPVARPDYPVPADDDLLFYIQRSTNSNTIVYAANFLPDGTLDPKRPVDAFWRRFNTSGERKPLGYLENRMAYGMRFKKTEKPNQYQIWFVSLPERPALLVQKKPGVAELRMRLGRYEVKPAYAYVTVDESGLFGSVDQIAVHGTDRASGKAVTEIIPVSGGRIGP